MQTRLTDLLQGTRQGSEAESILRACVHCGFCNASCPTYRLLADERDGPRGRIYLIKEALEGAPVSHRTRLHLDRCLTCRACETACPSGVEYGRLLDIGREMVERHATRPWAERQRRALLRAVLPHPRRLAPLLRVARALRPFLSGDLRRRLPMEQRERGWPRLRHPRRMIAFDGCVQSVVAPDINAAAARVLDTLGISLVRIPDSGCCGALSHHLEAREEAMRFGRRNIDAWWPAVEQGAEAIVVTASGCGVMLKDYGRLFRDDPAYAERAARLAALTKSIGEVLAAEDWARLPPLCSGPVAFHAPCTLQHGQQAAGSVEALLRGLGCELTPVADPHLCCGSAGTYSILQPDLAARLRQAKLEALERGRPDCILTDNIGCQLHLQSGTTRPVRHWIEVLADGLSAAT